MKHILLIIILVSILISGCVDETRTMPDSIEYNEKFTVLKVNPDRIRFAVEPALYKNQVIYRSDNDKYSSYDLDTSKTRKSGKEIHTKAIEDYKELKYGPVTFNGLNIIYKNRNSGEIILQTSDSKEHRFGIGENYVVWSDYYVGKPDKIHLMKIADGSVKDIEPSQEFISKAGTDYSGELGFRVFELGLSSDKIIVQTSKCIYMYDAETLEEAKIICDENLMTKMNVYGNKIIFQGNSANKPVEGYVNRDIFLVTI